MDITSDTNILESLILDSYQNLYSITESIMEIKSCENAYKLDMKSIMESNNTSLQDGRTERYNNDKVSLIEKAKNKISEFLKYIRDKVVEFYNTFINFLKKSINSDKKLIKKYKDSKTITSVEGYKYTIDVVLNNINTACLNFNNSCKDNKATLIDDTIISSFRKTILATDNVISKEEFESNIFKVLRSDKANTETISGTVGDFCTALEYEKDIKSLYKLISLSKKYFDPKYLNDILDYDITDENMTKSLEVLNELKNTLLFTLNACKNAINERNTMIRQAIIDGVKNEKENVSESCIIESVLEEYDIDEVLESDLGLEYFTVESYIGNNELVTEGAFSNLKDKAIKIIEKVIRFIKSVKDKVVKLVKQKLKKDIKNSDTDIISNSTEDYSKEKFISSNLDEMNARAYIVEVTNVISRVDRLLVDIMQMSARQRFSDLEDLKKFNSESHDLDVSGILTKLDNLTSTKKSLTVNEIEIVKDYLNDIKKIIVDKFDSIDGSMNKMIKYNQDMIKNLKTTHMDPEIVRQITILTNTQQIVTNDYLILLNSIIERVSKIETDINHNLTMESFVSVLDSDEVLEENFYLHQEVPTVDKVKTEKVIQRISKLSDNKLVNSYNELKEIKSEFTTCVTKAKAGKKPSVGSDLATKITTKILNMGKSSEDLAKEYSNALDVVKLQLSLTKKEIDKRGLKVNNESFILEEGIKDIFKKFIKKPENVSITDYDIKVSEKELKDEFSLAEQQLDKALKKYINVEKNTDDQITNMIKCKKNSIYQGMVIFGYIAEECDGAPGVSKKELSEFKKYLHELTKTLQYHKFDFVHESSNVGDYCMIRLLIKENKTILVIDENKMEESFTSVLDEEEFVYESVLDMEDDTFVSVLDM